MTPSNNNQNQEWCGYRHEWTLDTGVKLTINNMADWVVFGDVFLNREYDLNLTNKKDRPAVIVDLGANVGYFSLLVAHECMKVGQAFNILAFEGNYGTYTELCKRTGHIGFSGISPCYGLVGKKLGSAFMTNDPFHGANHIDETIKEHSLYAPTPYLNLDEYFILDESIDLLKCDIEGSEHDLVREYPELLRRTDTVIMEIHYLDEAPALYTAMESYGFNYKRTLMNHGSAVTVVFGRT